MTKRDRVIMMKTERPKRVTLPNGRTFITRYKRVTRAHLPANVCLARPYKEKEQHQKVDNEDDDK